MAGESMIGKFVVKILGDNRGLEKALNNARKKTVTAIKGIGSATKKIGKVFLTAGATITAGFGATVKIAHDFGAALAEVATLGVKDMKGLKKGIMDVTAAYGGDLIENTKAAYQAISAGVEPAKVLEFLDTAARGAMAGVAGTAETVDALTNILNAFGKESGQANDVLDQLFVAIKEGKTTMSELAGAVGRLAPTFNAAGLGSDEMLAATAALTASGISTNEAMTGLNGILKAIIKPSKEAADITAALGLEFDTTALKTKGVLQFLKDLSSQLKENIPALQATIEQETRQRDALEASIETLQRKTKRTRAENLALREMKDEFRDLEKSIKENSKAVGPNIEVLSRLFGEIEGLKSVLVLANKDAGKFNEVMGEMEERVGAADEAAQKFKENDPGFAFRQMKAEVINLAVNIGDVLSPVLNKLIADHIKPMIAKIKEWKKENPQLFEQIVKWTAAAGALMLVLGPILIVLGLIVPIITFLTSTIGLWTLAIVAVTTAGVAFGLWIDGIIDKHLKPLASAIDWVSDRLLWFYNMWKKVSGLGGGNGAKLGKRTQELIDQGLDVDSPGGFIPKLVAGANRFLGGLAIVGEQGPELIRLPRGSDVISAPRTAALLAGAGGGGFTVSGPLVSIANMIVRNEGDIRRVAAEIERRIAARVRERVG